MELKYENIYNINAIDNPYKLFLKDKHYIEDIYGNKSLFNKYVIKDINKDGIQDLILINKEYNAISIYTYNKKVIPVPIIVEETFSRSQLGIEENGIVSNNTININNKDYHLAHSLININSLNMSNTLDIYKNTGIRMNSYYISIGGYYDELYIDFSIKPKDTSNNKIRDSIYKQVGIYIYNTSYVYKENDIISKTYNGIEKKYTIYNRLYTLKKSNYCDDDSFVSSKIRSIHYD